MTETRSLVVHALTALRGEMCVCGARKRSMQSFCGKCWRALPGSMREDLYKPVSEGYAEIYAEAKEWLRDEGRRG